MLKRIEAEKKQPINERKRTKSRSIRVNKMDQKKKEQDIWMKGIYGQPAILRNPPGNNWQSLQTWR